METFKVLVKLALAEVGLYVTDNWKTKTYMEGNSAQLGYFDVASLAATNILSFSRPVTSVGYNLALTTEKVTIALNLLKAADDKSKIELSYPTKDNKEQNETAFLGALVSFGDLISEAIKQDEKVRGKDLQGSLHAALHLSSDVFDDFISTSKKEYLTVLLYVFSFENKCRNENGDFPNASAAQSFAYVIRMFATLAGFAHELRKEEKVKSSSKYPQMCNEMRAVIEKLSTEIRLLNQDTTYETFYTTFQSQDAADKAAEDKTLKLMSNADGMYTALSRNGFTELAKKYEDYAKDIRKNILTGIISKDIEMFPSEVLAPKAIVSTETAQDNDSVVVTVMNKFSTFFSAPISPVGVDSSEQEGIAQTPPAEVREENALPEPVAPAAPAPVPEVKASNSGKKKKPGQ